MIGLQGRNRVQETLLWSTLWILFSSLGFFSVTNIFVKRWNGILARSDGGLSPFKILVLRIGLLSPLLSIWMTLITLFSWRERRPSDRHWLTSLWGLPLTLLLFHGGYLWLQTQQGQMVWQDWRPELKDVITPRMSLKTIFSSGDDFEKKVHVLPPDFYYVHIFPYLNPGSKYLSTLVTDFFRSQIILNSITSQPNELCRTQLEFVGQVVQDCFFYNYRKVGVQLGFSTPISGLMGEMQYRSKMVRDSLQHSVAQLTDGLLMFNNMLVLMESQVTNDINKIYFNPEGLNRFYSSPEIPLLRIGNELQKNVVRRTLLAKLTTQWLALKGSMPEIFVSNASRGLSPLVVNEMKKLDKRIKKLERKID